MKNEHSNARILIVDDEEVILKILRRLLKKSGYTNVITALNARQALKIIETAESQFAVIISDQNMPGMPGTDFFARCASLTPDSRRILLTGYSDVNTAMEGVNKGAIHYYQTKPWDNEGLDRVVRQEIAAYYAVVEEKDLLSITNRQNARLYKFASTLKEKDRTFRQEIRIRHEKVKSLTKAIAEKEALKATVPGLETMLSRTVIIRPESLTAAYSVMKEEIVGLFETIAGTTGCRLSADTGEGDGDIRSDDTHSGEAIYELVDQILDQIFVRVEPRLLDMPSTKSFALLPGFDTVQDVSQLALSEGLISLSEVENARSALAENKTQEHGHNALEMKLVELGYLRRSDLSRLVIKKALMDMKAKDGVFAAILLEQGLISRKDVDQAFVIQENRFQGRYRCIPIGDILVESGKLDSETRDRIMKEQDRDESPLLLQPGTESAWTDEEVTGDSVHIEISDDRMSAWITVSRKATPSPSLNQLLEALSEKGITFGIVSDLLITGYLKHTSESVKKFLVATGSLPVHGNDAEIKYNFDVSYRRAGIVRDDGSIDFMDRGEVPFVTEGTLLAEKIPAEPGKPGRDIFGEPVEADVPQDVAFRHGSGTRLSDDGLKIYAESEGQPILDAMGTVSIVNDLLIRGDVDFESGHISFKGNVVVSGIVKESFRVSCVNLTVSEINGGIIDASGDVNVSNGIINAHVRALGNVTAKYVNNSTLDVFGNIEVMREIMGSSLFASGTIKNARGRITGSTLAARRGLELGEAGTERSVPAVLKPGCTDHHERLLQNLDDRIRSAKEEAARIKDLKGDLEQRNFGLHKKVADLSFSQEKMEGELLQLNRQRMEPKVGKAGMVSILKEVKRFHAEIARVAGLIKEIFNDQDRLMKEIDAMDSRLGEITESIEDLELEKEAFREIADLEEAVPVLTIGKRIFSGTRIIGPAASLIIKDTMKACRIMEIESSAPNDHERRQMVIQTL